MRQIFKKVFVTVSVFWEFQTFYLIHKSRKLSFLCLFLEDLLC